MHLYILTRGIKKEVDSAINFLEAQFLPYKFEGKDQAVQLAVRPIQLWEMVMPEPSLQTVMKSLWEEQPTIRSNMKPLVYGMRKMLGAKKIPLLDKKAIPLLVDHKNVAIYPVGIKPDKYNDDGEVL